MLSFNIIREDIIPTVQKIDSFSFVSGEKRTIAIQLVNKYDGNPYIVPTGFVVEITFKTTVTATNITKTADIDSTNKSIISVTLSSAETQSIIQGPIQVQITETLDLTNIKMAIRDNLLCKKRI